MAAGQTERCIFLENKKYARIGTIITYKTVKMNIVTLKATKALQEAMARIETLEAEVAKLKE